MATGDVADAVDQTQQNQTEAQTDAQHTDFRPCKHCASAGQEYKEHCPDALRKILSHNN